MTKKNLLTVGEASDIITEAYLQVETNKGYRFGQAVFNLLPQEIAEQIRGTEYDFFYWDDRKDLSRRKEINDIVFGKLSDLYS